MFSVGKLQNMEGDSEAFPFFLLIFLDLFEICNLTYMMVGTFPSKALDYSCALIRNNYFTFSHIQFF